MSNPLAALRELVDREKDHPCRCEVCKVAGDKRYVTGMTYAQLVALLAWCERAEKERQK